MTSLCSDSLDEFLGPRVDPCRRSFDFTIAFEDVVAIGVSAIFLLVGLCRFAYVYRRPHRTYNSVLSKLKLVS